LDRPLDRQAHLPTIATPPPLGIQAVGEFEILTFSTITWTGFSMGTGTCGDTMSNKHSGNSTTCRAVGRDFTGAWCKTGVILMDGGNDLVPELWKSARAYACVTVFEVGVHV
jgi:hypothetical protein